MADTSRLRGHPLKLRKDRSRLDLRKFTFSQRVVNMWNDLPAEVVTASSVKMFKNKLEAHLKNLPRRSPEQPQQNAPSLLMHSCFYWCFLTSVKSRLLNRVQGYVPLHFIHIYIQMCIFFPLIFQFNYFVNFFSTTNSVGLNVNIVNVT